MIEGSPACNKWVEGEKITLDLFREMCKEHDLTFEYSDDSGAYNRGHQQKIVIERAAQYLPAGIAAQIWNQVVSEKVLPGPWVAEYMW